MKKYLVDFGVNVNDKKITAVKEMREIIRCRLVEAKSFVETRHTDNSVFGFIGGGVRILNAVQLANLVIKTCQNYESQQPNWFIYSVKEYVAPETPTDYSMLCPLDD